MEKQLLIVSNRLLATTLSK